jgi:predicted DNA-binding transcriptional regulator AlpA
MSTSGNPAVLDGYITREELAGAINKSVRTIDRWDVHRVGPPRVVIGRTILYRVESVREWLQSREQRKGRAQ